MGSVEEAMIAKRRRATSSTRKKTPRSPDQLGFKESTKRNGRMAVKGNNPKREESVVKKGRVRVSKGLMGMNESLFVFLFRRFCC